MSTIQDWVDGLGDARKTLAESNDGNETITLRLQDLRDVLHDAIGDVKRYSIMAWNRASDYTELRQHNDPDGEWMKVHDVDRLESQIATALIEARVP
jgi:hypothetical protein